MLETEFGSSGSTLHEMITNANASVSRFHQFIHLLLFWFYWSFSNASRRSLQRMYPCSCQLSSS